ncbi:KPN_02809 family neutral zinc metallopeptidase [Rubrivirga litoralis]|uniref:Neutral zinc metallopeptidase n=1 Tax=Rubrivirga litoralis TaxID=3075598 RepID=A0ABU3BSS4_9BACT|nr:neutral zinc metallopeptidase [Rubrivirga sp. F394]MDT0632338.1 neutral zinc metallopeptidase [Rubrivirga sp. F394]
MLIKPGRSSGNLIDRRGGRGGRGGRVGLGLGGLVVVLIAAFFGLPVDQFLGGGGAATGPVETTPSAPQDEASQVVDAVLASTEDVWGALYRQTGDVYPEPNLVLYEGATPTGCGYGQAATGPFYCPSDQTVYLDLSFFRQLAALGARGDFPLAYVIAHEVGHHVQNVEGLLGRSRSNAMSVQTELQADCLAGVWAHYAQDEGGAVTLDDADIEEGISAAAAVGDDRLQERAGGVVRPESFTHGSSRQRAEAFLAGYQGGDYAVCFR